MTDSRLYVRFPSTSFVSLAEFDQHTREARATLDARYLYEHGLASKETQIERDGTCAPCLRRARFTTQTADGEVLADGRRIPAWREQLICDCEYKLSNRNRAILHFLEAECALQAWSRVLLFGPPSPVDRRIAAATASVASIPRLRLVRGVGNAFNYRLPAAAAMFDIVVSMDYLQRVPPLDTALAEIRRVLVPGGWFVLTVPMRYRSAQTVTRVAQLPRVADRLSVEAGGEVHELGWDILDRLRSAGFSDARVHTYWSNELGYLGYNNLILSAVV